MSENLISDLLPPLAEVGASVWLQPVFFSRISLIFKKPNLDILFVKNFRRN